MLLGTKKSGTDGGVLIKDDNWSFILCGDEIQELHYKGTLVASSIRPAVRDINWNTAQSEDLKVTNSKDPLRICVNGEYNSFGIAAFMEFSIVVQDNSFEISYKFIPRKDIRTNRTGLTFMIPSEYSGSDATFTNSKGYTNTARLPKYVSPHQPILDICEINYNANNQILNVKFQGDTFEMEDQRNWCDASFKIYSRELAAPFPYTLRAGTEVVQKIIIEATSSKITSTPSDTVRCERKPLAGEPRLVGTIPTIGVGATTQLSETFGTCKIGAYLPDSLLLELAEKYDLKPILNQAIKESGGGIVPIDLRIAVSSPSAASTIFKQVISSGLTVASLGIFDSLTHISDARHIVAARKIIEGQNVCVIGGTRGHFAEFNRNIHKFQNLADQYQFSLTPQMHVQEKRHITRSLRTLPKLIASAKDLINSENLAIAPVTLRPRLNTVSTETDIIDLQDSNGYGAHLVAESDDPRQFSSWAATWLCAYLIILGIHSVPKTICLEGNGARGVIPSSYMCDVLSFFIQEKGNIIENIPTHMSDIYAATIKGEKTSLVIANLSSEDCLINLGDSQSEFIVTSESFSIKGVKDLIRPIIKGCN